MADLSDEERERIYLEEKAKREKPIFTPIPDLVPPRMDDVEWPTTADTQRDAAAKTQNGVIAFLVVAFGFAFLMWHFSQDPLSNTPHFIPTTPDNTLTRTQFGADWPFTVDSVELSCSDNGGVLVTADGSTYAVNGTSMGEKNGDGTPKYVSIRDSGIWAEYPNVPGAKIGIGPVMDRGLAYCKQ